jgi:hypothetical protein
MLVSCLNVTRFDVELALFRLLIRLYYLVFLIPRAILLGAV